MHYPKITIITPSLNQGEFLEAALRSVLEQNYPELEYFVYDGGSSDSSQQILEKYSDRLAHCESGPDAGQAEAINKGLERASGEIVNWLNSDDQLEEGSLLKVAQAFSAAPPEVGLIYGTALQFDQNGPIGQAREFEQADINRYLAGVSFPQSAAFIRKAHLDQVGYLNTDFHYGLDYELYSRLALVCKFERIPDQLARNRMHPASKEISHPEAFTEDWIRVFNGLVKGFGWEFPELNDLKRNTQAKLPALRKYEANSNKTLFYFLTEILRADYRNGNFKRARIIKRYLLKNYSDAELAAEQQIAMILRRLRYPDLLIKSFRKVPIHRVFKG